MQQVFTKIHIRQRQLQRLTAFVLILAFLFFAATTIYAVEDAAQSGSCGTSLSWSFHAGTLTITGTGDMTDFTEPDMAPWYGIRHEITRVVFPDGLTSIGNLAFYDCINLKTAILPDSVRSIGHYSFASCEGLEVVRLGEAVGTIGNAAFYGCLKLAAAIFPYGLERLGYQAFYRCESLATVTIPPYVTEMGSSVFAYCKNLIKAEINAPLKSLPDWTFYGCERLTVVVLAETVGTIENYAFKRCDDLLNVYFSGDNDAAESIRQGIEEDVPGFAYGGYVGTGVASDSNMSGKVTENEDGSIIQENTTVTEGDNMTLVSTVVQNRPASTTETTPGVTPGTTASPGTTTGSQSGTAAGGSYRVDLTLTVENKDGWDSAKHAVQNTLKEINGVYSGNATSEGMTLTVYIKDDGSIDGNFLQEIAERQLTMTVVSPDGSSWKVDCSHLVKDNLTGKYDYSYTIVKADAAVCEKLGTDRCYQLTFAQSAEINAEVLIQLPSTAINSNAFLYQVASNGEYTRLQAVAVDNEGRAHFYLAAVNGETRYIIGLNVPSESTDDVIIPDELFPQYGNGIDRIEKIEYVVTGVESSWGLNFWQVTGIMVGALVVVVGAVGAAMFFMNKRSAKLARTQGGSGVDPKGHVTRKRREK